MDPLKVISHAEAITQDVMNENTGNMLFVHGLTRALLLDDTVLHVTKTNKNFSRADVDRINEE